MLSAYARAMEEIKSAHMERDDIFYDGTKPLWDEVNSYDLTK